MAVPFQVFVAAYAVALMMASIVVLTSWGQGVMLRAMRWVGTHSNLGPWGFLKSGADSPRMDAMPVSHRARLAEEYIAEAEQRTLDAARLVLWVLIGGCVATAFTAIIIVSILPPLVVGGRWTYETYRRVSLAVVWVTAVGGIATGIALIAWLVRRVLTVSCSERCAATRSLVTLVRRSGVTAELAHELSLGAYPRLRRLLHDMA